MPHNNYRSYFHNGKLLYHGYKPEVLTIKPINRWFTPGCVEPNKVSHSPSGNIVKTFLGLFRLFAAANIVYLKKPQESRRLPIAIRSCLGYPYSILAGRPADLKITKLEQSYKVHCSKYVLTNSVDHKLAES